MRRSTFASFALAVILVASPAVGAVTFASGPKLVGTGASPPGGQGSAVALSADGSTAIVGGSDDYLYTGAAWVFTRSAGVWTQQGDRLLGSGAVSGSVQGTSVALSADGNTALVGGAGVWVFTRSGGVWTQQGGILTNVQADSVALSSDGNTALVGSENDGYYMGAAWVFTRSGGAWTQQGDKLVGTGAVGNLVFQGLSVGLSADGNTALVGGHGDNTYVGAAWVFTRTAGIWTQQGDKLVGAGVEDQGRAVAISGDGGTAILCGGNSNPFSGDGAAVVFTRSGSAWTQQGDALVGTGVGALDGVYPCLSTALSYDGDTALYGAYKDDMGVGATWVFARSGGVWTQQGDKLVGTGAYGSGEQGIAVGLSSDGGTAIVGGWKDNANLDYTRGIGAAWIFERLDVPGDVNGDGVADVSDVFYLINYLFAGGPAPK